MKKGIYHLMNNSNTAKQIETPYELKSAFESLFKGFPKTTIELPMFFWMSGNFYKYDGVYTYVDNCFSDEEDWIRVSLLY